MTDGRFRVETIDARPAALAGAFCRRLHDAGVPVTPGAGGRPRPRARARAARQPAAAVLDGPRRCSCPTRCRCRRSTPSSRRCSAACAADAAFDARRRARRRRGGRRPPRAGSTTVDGQPRARRRRASSRPPARARGDAEDEDEVDVPLAAGERRGAAGRAAASTRSQPHELAQLYGLMSRLRLATPHAAHAPPRARPPRPAHRHAADAAPQPAHRRRPDPARAPAPAGRAAPAGACCATSPARWSRTPAPTCSSSPCAAGSGPNAEAFVFATRLTRLTRALAVAPSRAGDPARGGGGAGLVERHADRRRAEGVQRPPRPPRHGPRRGGRDPLRRLGAGRPRARRPRDGSGWRGSPTGSCGSTRA